MNILIQVAVIIYLFAAFPILLGLLGNRICKKEAGIDAEVYVNGYFGMLALFAVIAIPVIKSDAPLSKLTGIWMLVSAVLSGISFLLLCKTKKAPLRLRKNIKAFWQESCGMMRAVFLSFFVLSVISVLFVKPHAQDYTIAIVDTALATDTAYQYHPYTGDAYGAALETETDSPIEMLYAAAADAAKGSPALMIQFLLPVFLQLWFFLIYWQLGKQLFERNYEKQAVFMGVVLLLHMTSVYIRDQAVGVGMFQNPWNGQTLLICCILPGMLLQCLKLQKLMMNDWKWSVWEILKMGAMLSAILLSARLADVRGVFYVCLMLVITVLIILVRKGYRRYGTAFKNH